MSLTPKRSLFLAGMLCVGGIGAQPMQSPPADEAGFVQHLAERIGRAAGARVEPAGRLSLRLLNPEGSELLVANLDRVWSACQRVRDRCAAFVDEYVGGVASYVAERSRPPEKEALRIAVRSTSYLESIGKEPGKGPITRAFVGDLGLVLVIDGARSIRSAQPEDLQRLQLSEAQAFEAAKHNLRSRELKPLESVLKPITGRAIGYLEENAYESSRLVLHEDWKGYAEQIGVLVVAIPSTNFLIYGNGTTAEGIDALRAFALEVARKSQRPLSSSVFRWTARGWEVVR